MGPGKKPPGRQVRTRKEDEKQIFLCLASSVDTSFPHGGTIADLHNLTVARFS